MQVPAYAPESPTAFFPLTWPWNITFHSLLSVTHFALHWASYTAPKSSTKTPVSLLSITMKPTTHQWWHTEPEPGGGHHRQSSSSPPKQVNFPFTPLVKKLNTQISGPQLVRAKAVIHQTSLWIPRCMLSLHSRNVWKNSVILWTTCLKMTGGWFTGPTATKWTCSSENLESLLPLA